MTTKMLLQTIVTFFSSVAILGLLIFLPAGTLAYWQGWLFILAFSLSVCAIGLDLALNNPELLERRKKVGPKAEERSAQRIVMSLAVLSLPAMLIACGLDHRFGWSQIPAWLSVVGSAMVVLGLVIDMRVFRANSFGGSSIETVVGQHVITTGPYAVVRHPMYAGVLVMMIGIPLALGSWWGFAFVAIGVVAMVVRILDEESMLAQQLPGYLDYMRAERYRLVPYVW